MEIIYYPETDSLSVYLKRDYEGGYGEDLTPHITAIYSGDGEVVGLEIDFGASRHADVSKLEVAGLPAVLAAAAGRKPT